MNETEYLKNPGVCPYCGSSDVQSDGIEPVDMRQASDHVVCLNCNGEWRDNYTMTSVTELNPPACPHCGGDCPSGDDGCGKWKELGFEEFE